MRERNHWGDRDVDGRIILSWIFRKWEGVVGTEWSWLRILVIFYAGNVPPCTFEIYCEFIVGVPCNRWRRGSQSETIRGIS
jgi:hypothetical protein